MMADPLPEEDDEHLFRAESDEQGDCEDDENFECGQNVHTQDTTPQDTTPEGSSKVVSRPPRKKLFSPQRKSPYRTNQERKRRRCGCGSDLDRMGLRQDRFERVLKRVCVSIEKISKEIGVIKKYCMTSRPVIEANVAKTALACREIALLQEQNHVRMAILESVKQKNDYLIDEVQGLADFTYWRV